MKPPSNKFRPNKKKGPQSIQYLKQLWVIASNNENLSIRKVTRCLLTIASNITDKNRTFCEQWDGPSENNEGDLQD